jgi:hypothetical protein
LAVEALLALHRSSKAEEAKEEPAAEESASLIFLQA